jgi:hypothetical protein
LLRLSYFFICFRDLMVFLFLMMRILFLALSLISSLDILDSNFLVFYLTT